MARTIPSSPREIGRIRCGDRQQTSNGKMAPHKLEYFRLTSDSYAVLQSAAKRYGGEVQEWPADRQHPKDEYQLYTTADTLRVTIPVHYALGVTYEQWSAGGCIQRCDGATITHCPLSPEKIGHPCECDDLQEDACPRILRFNVLLTEVSGLGVWRLESKGYYATARLNNDMEKFQAFGLRGMMVPANLRLVSEERRILMKDPKAPKGRRTEKRQFYVPTLEFLITPQEFMLAAAERRPELLLPEAERPQRLLSQANDHLGVLNEQFGDPVNPTAWPEPTAEQVESAGNHVMENDREKRALVNQINMELKRQGQSVTSYWDGLFSQFGVDRAGAIRLDTLQALWNQLQATRPEEPEETTDQLTIDLDPNAPDLLELLEGEMLDSAIVQTLQALAKLPETTESTQHLATLGPWRSRIMDETMTAADLEQANAELRAAETYILAHVEVEA